MHLSVRATGESPQDRRLVLVARPWQNNGVKLRGIVSRRRRSAAEEDPEVTRARVWAALPWLVSSHPPVLDALLRNDTFACGRPTRRLLQIPFGAYARRVVQESHGPWRALARSSRLPPPALAPGAPLPPWQTILDETRHLPKVLRRITREFIRVRTYASACQQLQDCSMLLPLLDLWRPGESEVQCAGLLRLAHCLRDNALDDASGFPWTPDLVAACFRSCPDGDAARALVARQLAALAEARLAPADTTDVTSLAFDIETELVAHLRLHREERAALGTCTQTRRPVFAVLLRSREVSVLPSMVNSHLREVQGNQPGALGQARQSIAEDLLLALPQHISVKRLVGPFLSRRYAEHCAPVLPYLLLRLVAPPLNPTGLTDFDAAIRVIRAVVDHQQTHDPEAAAMVLRQLLIGMRPEVAVNVAMEPHGVLPAHQLARALGEAHDILHPEALSAGTVAGAVRLAGRHEHPQLVCALEAKPEAQAAVITAGWDLLGIRLADPAYLRAVVTCGLADRFLNQPNLPNRRNLAQRTIAACFSTGAPEASTRAAAVYLLTASEDALAVSFRALADLQVDRMVELLGERVVTEGSPQLWQILLRRSEAVPPCFRGLTAPDVSRAGSRVYAYSRAFPEVAMNLRRQGFKDAATLVEARIIGHAAEDRCALWTLSQMVVDEDNWPFQLAIGEVAMSEVLTVAGPLTDELGLVLRTVFQRRRGAPPEVQRSIAAFLFREVRAFERGEQQPEVALRFAAMIGRILGADPIVGAVLASTPSAVQRIGRLGTTLAIRRFPQAVRSRYLKGLAQWYVASPDATLEAICNLEPRGDYEIELFAQIAAAGGYDRLWAEFAPAEPRVRYRVQQRVPPRSTRVLIAGLRCEHSTPRQSAAEQCWRQRQHLNALGPEDLATAVGQLPRSSTLPPTFWHTLRRHQWNRFMTSLADRFVEHFLRAAAVAPPNSEAGTAAMARLWREALDEVGSASQEARKVLGRLAGDGSENRQLIAASALTPEQHLDALTWFSGTHLALEPQISDPQLAQAFCDFLSGEKSEQHRGLTEALYRAAHNCKSLDVLTVLVRAADLPAAPGRAKPFEPWRINQLLRLAGAEDNASFADAIAESDLSSVLGDPAVALTLVQKFLNAPVLTRSMERHVRRATRFVMPKDLRNIRVRNLATGRIAALCHAAGDRFLTAWFTASRRQGSERNLLKFDQANESDWVAVARCSRPQIPFEAFACRLLRDGTPLDGPRGDLLTVLIQHGPEIFGQSLNLGVAGMPRPDELLGWLQTRESERRPELAVLTATQALEHGNGATLVALAEVEEFCRPIADAWWRTERWTEAVDGWGHRLHGILLTGLTPDRQHVQLRRRLDTQGLSSDALAAFLRHDPLAQRLLESDALREELLRQLASAAPSPARSRLFGATLAAMRQVPAQHEEVRDEVAELVLEPLHKDDDQAVLRWFSAYPRLALTVFHRGPNPTEQLLQVTANPLHWAALEAHCAAPDRALLFRRRESFDRIVAQMKRSGTTEGWAPLARLLVAWAAELPPEDTAAHRRAVRRGAALAPMLWRAGAADAFAVLFRHPPFGLRVCKVVRRLGVFKAAFQQMTLGLGPVERCVLSTGRAEPKELAEVSS